MEFPAGFLLSPFYSAWDPTREWSYLHIEVGFPSSVLGKHPERARPWWLKVQPG